MTKEELIEELKATLVKTKVDKLSKIVKQQSFSLRDLVDVTFHENKNIAFRAAWVLENVFLENPVFYLFGLDYLVKRFPEVQYPSCKRHYAKIIMHLTAPKAHPLIKQKLQDTDMEPIVEKCFDWLIDPKVLIAVKVFASEALFNLRHRYDWVAEELANQIQFLMRNGSPAIQSRGKKLLATLFVN
jgi:hypothetical protein